MFSWHRHKGDTKGSRIDNCLISPGWVPKATSVEYTTNGFSDHKGMSLTILDRGNQRGPGIWKLNNKLLEYDSYSSKILSVVEGVKTAIEGDIFNKWELVKFRCAEASRNFSRERAAE